MTFCGSVIFLTGCDTPQDSNAVSQMFGALAGSSTGESAQMYNMASQDAAQVASQQRQDQANALAAQQQEDAANQQALSSGAHLFNDAQYGLILVVTCNDGSSGCDPNQFSATKFAGIKNIFSTRESVEISVHSTNPYDGWNYKVLDENGFVIRNGAMDGSTSGWYSTFSPVQNNALSTGHYAYCLYINDTLLKKIYFTIIDD